MKKIFKIILLLIIIIVLLSIYFCLFGNKKTLILHTASGAPLKYQVELALTPEAQQHGLMDRKKLHSKTGMLFLFTPNRVAHMWMKNTLIPLDMVFFNRHGQVILVHHNAIPQDETVISSIRPVAGVLEINAGEAQKYGIDTETKIDLKSIQ